MAAIINGVILFYNYILISFNNSGTTLILLLRIAYTIAG